MWIPAVIDVLPNESRRRRLAMLGRSAVAHRERLRRRLPKLRPAPEADGVPVTEAVTEATSEDRAPSPLVLSKRRMCAGRGGSCGGGDGMRGSTSLALSDDFDARFRSRPIVEEGVQSRSGETRGGVKSWETESGVEN